MATSAGSSKDDLQHFISDHAFINITKKYGTKINELKHYSVDNEPPRRKFLRLRELWTWLITDSWTLEYIGILLAVAALASIGIILGLYHERPLTEWKHSINLNTLLSILATILKGATLFTVGSCLGQSKWIWYHRKKRRLDRFQAFDAASRGPMGATRLLVVLGFSQLASIGCLVTVMALVSDAFVQQSVRYPLRRANNTATVPISQYYDRGAYPGSIEQSMIAAIYDGALIANLSATSAAISPQCPTGNCTFPTHASLAVSSECLDVSTLIQDKCVNVLSDDCLTEAHLPNGLSLQNEGIYRGIFTMSSTLPLNTKKFDPYQHNVTGLTVILYDVIATTSSNTGWTIYNATEIFAYDCIFLFCAQTFDAVVSQGQFSETVVQTHHTNYTDEGYAHLTIPQGLIPNGSNLTFGASPRAWTALHNWMRQNMNGTGITEYLDSDTWDNEIIHAVSQNGASRVPQTMANIATAITNRMRVDSGQKIQGTAIALESYIHVRWPWLLLPIAMVVLAIAFLLPTVWQSRRWGVPSWRSSVLAAMMHGTEKSGTSLLEIGSSGRKGKEKISDLEEWAAGLHVRLRQGGSTGASYGLMRAG